MNPFYEQFKAECRIGRGSDIRDIGPFYKGVLYQRGYGLVYSEPCPYHMYGLGLGDTLGNLFQIAWPVLRQGLQYLGKRAVDTAANIAQDAITGRNLQEASKEHISSTAQEILAKAPSAISKSLAVNTDRDSRPAISPVRTTKRATSRSPAIIPRKRQKLFGRGLLERYPLLKDLN